MKMYNKMFYDKRILHNSIGFTNEWTEIYDVDLRSTFFH